ncbi:MAG: protein jag, partial [Bacteroidia bacterium]|nr:protein jag [Bacteroidia bacterium]
AFAARKAAKEVQKTKMEATLEAMPADERRVVHNALANFSHIKTESAGEGNHRAVVIKYVE